MSRVPSHLVLSCEGLVTEFIAAYNKGEDIKPYLTSNEPNFGGGVWMPLDNFIGFLGQVLPKPITDFEFDYYTIDDLEQAKEIKATAVELSRVFNNYAILANGIINNRKATIVLNLEGEVMKIYSITIWDVPLIMQNTQVIIPKDTIERLNIAINIPKSFGEPTSDENFINYVKAGETERDETIQIINNPKQAELSLVTYKWAEYVTSKYKRSDFDISYVPNGYIYRYEIVDENERVNKGITVGIEHNEQIIFIQYFGFKEAYNEHWQELDDMLRNIQKL
jgi:hypothetical protein